MQVNLHLSQNKNFNFKKLKNEREDMGMFILIMTISLPKLIKLYTFKDMQFVAYQLYLEKGGRKKIQHFSSFSLSE